MTFTIDPANIPDLTPFVVVNCSEVESLRQNRLLDALEIARFARDIGIPQNGEVAVDVSDLWERGWLRNDGTWDDQPLFHPFRLYPLHRVLQSYRLGISTAVPPERVATLRLVNRALDTKYSIEEVSVWSRVWNRAADLAILLEPLYWPAINGEEVSLGKTRTLREFTSRRNLYGQRVSDLIHSQPVDFWQEVHRHLVLDAAGLDRNGSLYLLLRVSTWKERKGLTGPIAGAMWIRHMAEVIRPGFEDVRGVFWPEEDQGIGQWAGGGRQRAFGSARPLDDVRRQLPFPFNDNYFSRPTTTTFL